MRIFGFMVICFAFCGCATLKLIQYPLDQPNPPDWVMCAIPDGYFRGMATNAANDKIGREKGINDVKRQICNSIGLELREEYEKKVIAYSDEIDKRVVMNFGYTSGAIIEDVESNVKDEYWQIWLDKTVKRHFHKYYVLVYYPQKKIDEMRNKTKEENEKRLSHLNRCLEYAKEEEIKDNFMEALRTYIYALFIADTLFSNRQTNAFNCLHRIKSLISSLNLNKWSNYYEKAPQKHRVSVIVMIDKVPARNVPVRFRLIRGKGELDSQVYTNEEGIATSIVSMRSISEGNIIRAFIDLNDLLSNDERISSMDGRKKVSFVFSTLSKIANVKGGRLYLAKRKKGLFKKVWSLKFSLWEENGLGATFDRYRIKIEAKYRHKHFLSTRVDRWLDTAFCDFKFAANRRIEGGRVSECWIDCDSWFRDNLRSFQRKRHFNEAAITLTLYGKDDNGNPCSVSLYSGLLEREFLP